MKPRQDRPRLVSRVSTVVGIGALVAVAMAARSQGGQPSTPPSTAAAVVPVAVDSTMQDSTKRADSTAVVDSMALSDSLMMQTAVAMAPAPQAPAAWPVDPVTGQTIINGEPVVGRVFIMKKTDGTVKLGTWQNQYVGEALAPEPAIVGSSYTVPAPEHTRRIRTAMIQATLWGMDGKRSARELHYYRAQTTGAALGQR